MFIVKITLLLKIKLMESPISQTQGNSVLFQTSENVQNSNSFDNFSSDVTNFAENVLNYLDDDGL